MQKLHPIIETKRLTKDFGALRAVNEVNLEIYSGQIHSIIGPNGAGKTTLFNLLTGFISPTYGNIFLKGENINGFPPYLLSKKGVARSFQITSIFPSLSVFENIRVSVQSRKKESLNFLKHYRQLRETAQKANEILEFIGLSEKSNTIAKNLSYGEKRILDIGIALATDPEILLLDEPVSGLAAGDIEWMIKLIKKISEKITIVLIDHNIELVISVSDVITVLNQGSIIAQGTPDEIQRNDQVHKAYLGGY